MTTRLRRQHQKLPDRPGFAVPAGFLVAWAVVWALLAACVSAWLGLSVWLAPDAPFPNVLPIVPFVLIPLWSVLVMRRGCRENKPAIVRRGVRMAAVTVGVGGVLITVGMLWGGTEGGGVWNTLLLLSMGILMFLLFVQPLLLPLVAIERRLLTRAAVGDPAWHPRLANTRQRHDAVMGFCAALGAVSGLLVGTQHGLMNMPAFDAESVSQVGSTAMVGLLFGFAVGAMPGTLVAHALSDRDLSRALPPIALWTPIAAVGGSLAGVGWGVAAFAGAMLVVGKISCIRCKLFEPGRCQSCGYDLTGVLDDGGPCPECGSIVPAIG